MKWLKLCGALLAAMSMNSLADAGLLGSLRGDCGGAKGCGCAPSCQPQCCKPVIVKPCCPNVYTYQRKCSDIKPPCCDTCCPPATCCAPAANACAPAPAACAPACAAPAACAPAATTCAPAPAACAPACAAPAACAPAPAACAPACAAPAACAPAPAACAPACAAPAACGPRCAPACAAPTACAPACAAPVCCNNGKKLGGGLLGRLFDKTSKKNDCGAPAACTPACEVRCCNADPCEVATLIYESQTACKAKDRKKAIHKLGDKFDCICNPEIMTAFIVALNDCDEDVREKAADEIGDQIKKNCCCCPEVVAALTCALGDCDKGVVKQATEALERCGYEVVDGCCNPCGQTAACGTGACGTNGGYAPAPAAPAAAPAPAPVPPQDSQARRGALSNLLGLLD